MKALCPVCNVEGFLEQRGSNSRIKHYLGFENGKRKYMYHSLFWESTIKTKNEE